MERDLLSIIAALRAKVERYVSATNEGTLTCFAELDKKKCEGEVPIDVGIDTWPANDMCPACYKYSDGADKYEVYTDGSCLGNVSKNNPPAGWGFVVVDMDEEKVVGQEHGMVINDCRNPSYIGAEKMSNNTAELTAIYHALKWATRPWKTSPEITICYDSTYAGNSISGVFNGTKNEELITRCRSLLLKASKKATIAFRHVKAHSGNEYNDMADELAKKGAGLCVKRKQDDGGNGGGNKRTKN
jgi:ribonuclease HI